MIPTYTIKASSELSRSEIETILGIWNIDKWKQMNVKDFQQTFHNSEFHILIDNNSDILCIARINFDFKLKISDTVYTIPELVGLVSTKKMKGHGRYLISAIYTNLKSRKIEAIGFSEKKLRPFYEKCGIRIMYNKAKLLREKESHSWITPTDDDILDLTLSASLSLFDSLNPHNLGYLES